MRAWLYMMNLIGVAGYIGAAIQFPGFTGFMFGYMLAAVLCLLLARIDDWPVTLAGLIGSWIVTVLIWNYMAGDPQASVGVSVGFTLSYLGSCLLARPRNQSPTSPPGTQ